MNSSIFDSTSWIMLSALLMASTTSFLFLSSSAYRSDSFTMFSISSLDRPPLDWITTGVRRGEGRGEEGGKWKEKTEGKRRRGREEEKREGREGGDVKNSL